MAARLSSDSNLQAARAVSSFTINDLKKGTMKTKEISINGKTFKIAFVVKTMMSYEKITGKSFFEAKFSNLEERLPLIIAAILTVDDNPEITAEELMNIDNMNGLQDIISAFGAVMELSAQFFEQPAIGNEAEDVASDHAETEKN
jgi:hypothetical protein